MYYLGKKKKHTVKNQIKVNNGGFIIHKVGHKKGRRHDYDFQYLWHGNLLLDPVFPH